MQEDYGDVLSKLGRYEDAKKQFDQALPVIRSYYQENHPKTGRVKGSLGNVSYRLGLQFQEKNPKQAKICYEKAKKYYKQALKTYKKSSRYGASHPETAKVMGNLDIVRERLRHFDLAKKATSLPSLNPSNSPSKSPSKSLTPIQGMRPSKNKKKSHAYGNTNVHGRKHPIPTLQELLTAFKDKTLKEYLKNSSKIKKKKKGELMRLLNEIEKEQATPLMISSSEYAPQQKCKKNNRNQHLTEVTSESSLKKVHHELRNIFESPKIAEKKLDFCTRLFGRNHALTAEMEVTVADFYYTSKKRKEARQHYEKALKVNKLFYDKNPSKKADVVEKLAKVLSDLGACAKQLGYKKKAENYFKTADAKYQEVLEISNACGSKNHFLRAKITGNRGTIYMERGLYRDAEKYYRDALKIIPSGRIYTKDLTTANLGNTLVRQGFSEQGRQELDTALKANTRHCTSPKHMIRAGSLRENLAQVLIKLGWQKRKEGAEQEAKKHYIDAENKLKEALEIYRDPQCYGSSHVTLATVMENLGTVSIRLEKYEEAKTYLDVILRNFMVGI